MKYLKEYLFFKSKKPKNWEDKLKSLETEFQKIKKEKDQDKYYYLGGDVRPESFDFAYNKMHLLFSERNDDYEVTDFEEYDIPKVRDSNGNRLSTKGVYTITKSEYEKHKKFAQEISDYLDEKSEKEYNKSDSSIGLDGLNIDEFDLAQDDLTYELKEKVFDKYLGKKYEFEIEYYLWTEESKNSKIVERIEIPISDISIKYGGDRCYANISAKGIQGEDTTIWVEKDSNPNYYDLEENKIPERNKVLVMNVEKEEKSRKQKREEKSKFPLVISYTITPSKYNTIEFIKEVVGVLFVLNDQIDSRRGEN